MIAAVIPMRDHHEDTAALLDHLESREKLDHVIVIDNDSEDECCVEWLEQLERREPGLLRVWHHPGRDNFYRMWNDARQWVQQRARRDEALLLVLNNDVSLWPGTVATLAGALRSSDDDVWITYPDWSRPHSEGSSLPYVVEKTKGTRNSGGMSGYCFMMDVRAMDRAGVPLIHEGYELLCGDGDLVNEVESRGGTAARVTGLPLDHRESTTQSDDKNAEWARRARWRDRRRSLKREELREKGALE